MKMMAGALLAALGLFASCSKSGKDVQDPNQEGSTYVGITLSMGTNDVRANEDDNYSKKGTWNGKDEIKTIDVYVVDVASGVVSPKRTELPLSRLFPKLPSVPLRGQKRCMHLSMLRQI